MVEGMLGGARPYSRGSLRRWLLEKLNLEVPTEALVEGHAAPFDYLCHSYFDGAVPGEARIDGEDEEDAGRVALRPDSIVWANRGGGKTFLAAVATLLDVAFKPGIEVRILAGSLEQAGRMYRHLRELIEDNGLEDWVLGRATERRIRFVNGSGVELLSQSERSVRGTRVQKLRCDEVELFDPSVWAAAQLVTREKVCGGVRVPGTIECLSTMHIPYGLMWRLVQEAEETGNRALFKWGVVDVLGPCGDEHACGSCAIEPECGGRAKARDESGADAGHLSVEDAVGQKARVSEAVWASEMLCRRVRRDDCVLPEFDSAVHVFDAGSVPVPRRGRWVAGMDFGIRAPTVILWATVEDGTGVIRVWREWVLAGVPLARYIGALKGDAGEAFGCGIAWPDVGWVGIDPAGNQRSDQSGKSNAQVMRAAGLVVKSARLSVQGGLELLRARLRPALAARDDGTGGVGARLFVSSACEVLIESLEKYRYPADRPESLEPVKDGSDHAVDALRYLVQNVDSGYSMKSRMGGS